MLELIQQRKDLLRVRDELVLGSAIEQDAVRIAHLAESVTTASATVIHQQLEQLKNHYTELLATYNQLITEIEQEMDQRAASLQTSSYVTDLRLRLNAVDDITHDISTDHDMVCNVISKYANWKMPGLLLGCRAPNLVPATAATDPFYMADINEQHLRKALDQLEGPAKLRARLYLLTPDSYDMFVNRHLKFFSYFNPSTEHLVFDRLPQEQFGMVVSWNFFEYVAEQDLAVYLKQIIKLLQPGGVFVFGYNNCDEVIGLQNFLNNYKSYVPKHQLVKVLSTVGYEILEMLDTDESSLAVVRRPGTTDSVKASTVIGKKILKQS